MAPVQTATAEVIDGRAIAASLKREVAHDVAQLAADSITCRIATLAVGDNSAATAYERRLHRIASELGIDSVKRRLPASATQAEVVAEVERLNADATVTGLLILRPLPSQLSEASIFTALSPEKDIEAMHPHNAGLLALGRPRFIPSTPAAVFHVLDRWLDAAGEDREAFYHRSLIVVVGRSNNVGKPCVSLAYDRQAAVESIDQWASLNDQLGRHTRRADVLIVATGVPGLIRSEHVRKDSIILDVGINEVVDPETGAVHLVGDVDFDDVATRARAITPVPGGIGLVTDVSLLGNAAKAAREAYDARPVPIPALEWSA